MPAKTKKQIIFETAAKLFQEKGYPAASMRELATRVGLKVSSLYSHIGSKEEILQKICFDNASHFITGISEIEQLPVTATDQIKALIKLHIKIATEDVTSITVFNDEWKFLSEPKLSEFLKMRKDYEHRFSAIIQKGVDNEEFKDLNVTIVLFSILTSVRWLHYWYHEGRSISYEDLEENILTILMTGVQK